MAAETSHTLIERIPIFELPSLAIMVAVTALSGAALVGLLRQIGDASYSTYLTHYFVVEGMRKVINSRWGLVDIKSHRPA